MTDDGIDPPQSEPDSPVPNEPVPAVADDAPSDPSAAMAPVMHAAVAPPPPASFDVTVAAATAAGPVDATAGSAGLPAAATLAADEGGDVTDEGAGTDDDVAPPPRRAARLRRFVVRWRVSALGFGLAVATVIVLVRVGFVDDYGNTLQVMGFDPDRAVLLTSLLLGAIGSAIVAVVGGRLSVAVLTGAGIVLVAFNDTFAAETRQALRSRGADGTSIPLAGPCRP